MSVYDSLEFRHLKYIIAVGEAGSFTKASAHVHVAQSAISTQIAEIEDLFDIRLFTRHGKGVNLTVVGQSFLPSARQLLQAREDFIKAMQAIEQSSARPFSLGFTPFVEPHVIAAVTNSYRELFPSGDISPAAGEREEILDALSRGLIDAALLTLPLDPEGLVVHHLMSEPLGVCLRKDDPLALQQELAPQSLDKRLCIYSDPRRHPLAHARLLDMLSEQGIRPIVSNSTFNSGLVQWMVKDRHCLALIRQTESLLEEVTWRPIQGVRWTVDFALVYRSQQQHVALPLLIRDLDNRFSENDRKLFKKPPQSAGQMELQQDLPFCPSSSKIAKE